MVGSPATSKLSLTVIATPNSLKGSFHQRFTSLPGVGGTEAEQGVRIDVFIDGLLVGQDVPNGQGRWGVALLPEQTLERGPHTVLATAVDASGNTASTSVNFRVGRLLNDPPLKVGCTCTSAEPLLVFALLAPLLRRRRPGARHSATSASRSHRSRPE